MTDSFIKIPSKLIFNPAISALELRVLSVLVFWGGLNKQEPGHIKYGAEKLGQQIGIGRIACRKALLNLQKLNLIKIKHRGNLANESYGLSNDIELTISSGLKFLENGGSQETGDQYLKDTGDQYLKDTGHRYLKDTGSPYLKDTGVYLKDTEVYLKDTGHNDDRFKINLNLNKIHARNAQKEFSDVAENRSKPNSSLEIRLSDGIGRPPEVPQGLAKVVCAEGLGINDTDRQLFQLIREKYTDIYSDVELIRVSGQYGLRPRGKFALVEDIRAKEVSEGLAAAGFICSFVSPETHYRGEISISKELSI